MTPCSRLVAIVAVLATLSSPALAVGKAAGTGARAANPIVVDNAWFATMAGNGPTYGYFRISNNSGDPRLLTGYDSPACGALKLEEAHGGGLDSKAPVSMTVAAGTKLVFTRGGYHLVCEHPGAPLAPGQTVPVTIALDNGARLQTSFQVRPPPH